MENRSIAELQDDLDKKRMELLYVTEFELYLKDVKKINEAIAARKVINTKYNKEDINFIEIMKSLFDNSGRLNPTLPVDWTFDNVRSSHNTLKIKFLDNVHFSDADITIVDSIDSLIVQVMKENNPSLKPKVLEEKYNPFSKKDMLLMEEKLHANEVESRIIDDRANLIFNNARKSLHLNTINDAIYKIKTNGDMDIGINDTNNRESFSQHFQLAKKRYASEIEQLVLKIEYAKEKDDKAAKELLINLIDKFQSKNIKTERYAMINQLLRDLHEIQNDSKMPKKLDAMYIKIIECHVLANHYAKSDNLFLKSNLGNSLKDFMIEKCKMNKNEFNRLVRQININDLLNNKYKDKEDKSQEGQIKINRGSLK